MKSNKELLIKRSAVTTLTTVATISQAHAGIGFAEIVASWFVLVFVGAFALIVFISGAGKRKAKKALANNLRAGLIVPMKEGTTRLKSEQVSGHGIVDTSRKSRKNH